jgi:preprotein translocase subunit YajC
MQILAMAMGLLADGDNGGGNGGFQLPNPIILLAIMFFFYIIVMRPARDERKRRALLDGLKKNDRVVTSSGIKCVIASVNRDKNEAVVTIDKSTKAQMTVTLDSIAHVLVDESKADDSKASDSKTADAKTADS